ncbi:MAG: biopolymer transporter ExbD [bacterium]|nr:biopolymer transporter ExbD [bacterium]
MAELNTAEGGNKKHGGKVRSKKMSTKVDLTPMVDLAFLLITFFMLTTTLNKPNAMELNMPKKADVPEDKIPINEELLLNIILDKDNTVWWYEGQTANNLKKTIFANEKGIRDIIYWKQRKLAKDYGNKDTMIVLIKATDDANYENMVDALDEMDITGIKRYAMQDVQAPELEAIKNGGTGTTVPE